MALRRSRNQAISYAMEASYGASPGTFKPILLTGVPTFMIDPDVVPRDLVRGYFGGSEELRGTARAVMKFTTELAGSSGLGVPPEWGGLLQCCGWQEIITAGVRTEYMPITDNPASGAFRFNQAGVRYVSRGVRGTGKMNMTAYERPTVDWEFWGFDTVPDVTVIGTPTLTPWQRPLVITDANSGNIKLGSTYAAGVISGGTIYNSRGMTLDLGNKLEHLKMLGNEAIEITDRQMSGQMTVELDEATEVVWYGDIKANTLTSQSFNIGPALQNVAMFNAAVQRIKPTPVDYLGKMLTQVDLRILPTSGNDETRIIVK